MSCPRTQRFYPCFIFTLFSTESDQAQNAEIKATAKKTNRSFARQIDILMDEQTNLKTSSKSNSDKIGRLQWDMRRVLEKFPLNADSETDISGHYKKQRPISKAFSDAECSDSCASRSEVPSGDYQTNGQNMVASGTNRLEPAARHRKPVTRESSSCQLNSLARNRTASGVESNLWLLVVVLSSIGIACHVYYWISPQSAKAFGTHARTASTYQMKQRISEFVHSNTPQLTSLLTPNCSIYLPYIWIHIYIYIHIYIQTYACMQCPVCVTAVFFACSHTHARVHFVIDYSHPAPPLHPRLWDLLARLRTEWIARSVSNDPMTTRCCCSERALCPLTTLSIMLLAREEGVLNIQSRMTHHLMVFSLSLSPPPWPKPIPTAMNHTVYTIVIFECN